jgi:uncharacterized membrane protein
MQVRRLVAACVLAVGTLIFLPAHADTVPESGLALGAVLLTTEAASPAGDSEHDCVEKCKEQCYQAWEHCRDDCPRGNKNCLNECSQAHGRCNHACEKNCK